MFHYSADFWRELLQEKWLLLSFKDGMGRGHFSGPQILTIQHYQSVDKKVTQRVCSIKRAWANYWDLMKSEKSQLSGMPKTSNEMWKLALPLKSELWRNESRLNVLKMKVLVSEKQILPLLIKMQTTNQDMSCFFHRLSKLFITQVFYFGHLLFEYFFSLWNVPDLQHSKCIFKKIFCK